MLLSVRAVESAMATPSLYHCKVRLEPVVSAVKIVVSSAQISASPETVTVKLAGWVRVMFLTEVQ